MVPYSPTPRPPIKHRASPEDIRAIVSMIVMQGEPPAQHERLRHLQEELIRLTMKRDRVDDLRMTLKRDAFGRDVPDETQIAQLYELTQSFFQGFYAAMGALHSFTRHFRSWQVVEQHQPPEKGVERFIKWLSNVDGVSGAVIEELLRAREMRTLFDHPDQRPFDWGSTHDYAGLVVLCIFGQKGQGGASPVYAQEIAGAPGDWQVLAPSEVSVTNGLVVVLEQIAQGSHWRKFKSEEAATAWVQRGRKAESADTTRNNLDDLPDL